jgi:hypothetical protein
MDDLQSLSGLYNFRHMLRDWLVSPNYSARWSIVFGAVKVIRWNIGSDTRRSHPFWCRHNIIR